MPLVAIRSRLGGLLPLHSASPSASASPGRGKKRKLPSPTAPAAGGALPTIALVLGRPFSMMSLSRDEEFTMLTRGLIPLTVEYEANVVNLAVDRRRLDKELTTSRVRMSSLAAGTAVDEGETPAWVASVVAERRRNISAIIDALQRPPEDGWETSMAWIVALLAEALVEFGWEKVDDLPVSDGMATTHLRAVWSLDEPLQPLVIAPPPQCIQDMDAAFRDASAIASYSLLGDPVFLRGSKRDDHCDGWLSGIVMPSRMFVRLASLRPIVASRLAVAGNETDLFYPVVISSLRRTSEHRSHARMHAELGILRHVYGVGSIARDGRRRSAS